MVEILRAGQSDQAPRPIGNESYSESRSLSSIQRGFEQANVPFNFRDHFKQLPKRFPNARYIRILDGGCGQGSLLEDIHDLATSIRIRVRTVGIDKAERNIPDYEDATIDRFIVGTVQNAYGDGLIRKGQFHFVVDYFGALFYDYDNKDGTGSNILPVYSRVLTPRGSLLVFAWELEPKADWMQIRGKEQAEYDNQRFLDLINENNFRITMQKGPVALLEKSKPKRQ